MKREEKNQQMRQRIMDSALMEFSKQGYGGSSINTICAAQNISKGIVYHYFKTKDALYLACIAECFQRLTEYVRTNIINEECGIEEQLKSYFTILMAFFQANPVYQHIYCEAVITPPPHLSVEIRMCRQDFDDFNIKILERLLTSLSLRPNISRSEAIEIFRQFQDFINIRYQATAVNGRSFEAHEEDCQKMLSILLYGVIERR